MEDGITWLRESEEVPTLVVLDFDGTLAEIVERPGEAALLPGLRPVLEELRRRIPLGVLSGRGLMDLRGRLGMDGLYLGGSHGLEMMRPNGEVEEAPGLQEAQEALEEVVPELRERVATREGLELEEKPFSVALHFRREPEARSVVEAWLDDVTGPHLKVVEGKMVRELRPALDWDKGAALRWILEEMGAGPQDVPIYIGDDLTDEDGFAALSPPGGGILVAEEARPTEARWRLDDPNQVRRFLAFLVERIDGARGQPGAGGLAPYGFS